MEALMEAVKVHDDGALRELAREPFDARCERAYGGWVIDTSKLIADATSKLASYRREPGRTPLHLGPTFGQELVPALRGHTILEELRIGSDTVQYRVGTLAQ
jgi:hypothetical protein